MEQETDQVMQQQDEIMNTPENQQQVQDDSHKNEESKDVPMQSDENSLYEYTNQNENDSSWDEKKGEKYQKEGFPPDDLYIDLTKVLINERNVELTSEVGKD